MKTTAFVFVVASFLSLISSPATSTETTRTLTGEYVSSFETGMQALRAVFAPTGADQWDVVFHFEFHGKNLVYRGTAQGSL